MSIFIKNGKMYLTVNEFVKNNYLNLLIPLEENLSEGIHADGEEWSEKTYTYNLEELRTLIDNLKHFALYNYSAPERQIQPEFTDEQKKMYLPMALMMACVDGNAFPEFIEHYIQDAVAIIRNNGWDDAAVSKLEDTVKCFK